jgi:serine/threonine protein kinase
LLESQELEPGHIVRGKYKIVSKLGAGGMGIVYLAEHLMLGGRVALKFLAIELSKNPQFIKRFRQEARAAYQLRHPSIVEVADLDQDENGSLFIAMEYVAGPSLRTVLNRVRQGLPAERAVHIACGIAGGLAAAHGRGAIHRDIKPENILLATDPDGDEYPKILDFGIAAMTEGITNLSNTRGLLLTPQYAAPEQWRGTPAAELDGRTDLYALGGVLYEMLSGRTPFSSSNMEGWMYQHLQGTPEPLGRLCPDIERKHPGLEAIVMRLMAREREQRFPSAKAAVEVLARALDMPAQVPEVRTQIPDVRVQIPDVPAQIPEVSTQVAEVEEPVHIARYRTAVEVKPSALSAADEMEEEEAPRGTLPKWKIWAAAGSLATLAAIVLTVWVLRPSPATALPVLQLRPGTYTHPQPIVITDATPNAVIHYTLDGSPPTAESQVYSQPIASLPSGAIVRAMAVAKGHKPSTDVAGTFVWQESARVVATQQAEATYQQAISTLGRKQYVQARGLFNTACDGGEMKACNYLGYLVNQGLGGPRNEQQAVEIFRRACEQANLDSCASVGSLDQDAGNKIDARKYYQKACAGGVTQACKLLRDLQ